MFDAIYHQRNMCTCLRSSRYSRDLPGVPDRIADAQRLGGQTDPLPPGAPCDLAYILSEQVKVEVGERHSTAFKHFPIIGVVALLFWHWCGFIFTGCIDLYVLLHWLLPLD